MMELDISNASGVGVSQGGMIAQHLTLRHPEIVEKLVLVVTLSRPNPTVVSAIDTWTDMAKRGDYKGIMLSTAELSYTPKKAKQSKLTYGLLGTLGKPKNFDRFLVQARSCISQMYTIEISSMGVCTQYKGDALLQKQVTVDFLQKKVKKNEGEAPQYYVEGNHDAIIDPAVFDMAQVELEKRKNGSNRYSEVNIFSSKIKCGDCGGWYGSKVWHSNDKYRRVMYRCNNKYKGCSCQTPHVTEDEIKEGFVRALNEVLAGKDEIIANIRLIKKTLCKTADLEREKDALAQELTVVADMI